MLKIIYPIDPTGTYICIIQQNDLIRRQAAGIDLNLINTSVEVGIIPICSMTNSLPNRENRTRQFADGRIVRRCLFFTLKNAINIDPRGLPIIGTNPMIPTILFRVFTGQRKTLRIIQQAGLIRKAGKKCSSPPLTLLANSTKLHVVCRMMLFCQNITPQN